MKLKTNKHSILADTLTPVSIYLKLRDLYPNAILLESNLNEKRERSHSYICLNPIASFKVSTNQVMIDMDKVEIFSTENVADRFHEFVNRFEITDTDTLSAVFGHTNYNATTFFEDLEFREKPLNASIPLMHYSFYRFVISINHFSNEITFTEFLSETDESQLELLVSRVNSARFTSYPFRTESEESSYTEPEVFKNQVRKAKAHCRRGDVFQMVVSRRFYRKFSGDEFQVYRALRSINPSPYLFYFDMGSYKIFGSSPEAQVKINNHKAIINPIAGTYKRTGNYEEDLVLADKLKSDTKENSEHVMLVDLARNDLGRVATDVNVTAFREIHLYSHVIHMVSEVEGKLPSDFRPVDVFGQSFPAGTLSGAPKYRAMQLIDELEPVSRNFYGGGIGFVELNGNLNHAIMIRSMLSVGNELHYQAGAGVVVDSEPESELLEVDNKVGALRMAVQKAEDMK